MVAAILSKIFGSEESAEPVPAEEIPTDECWCRLRQEAVDTLREEPEMGKLLKQSVLAPNVNSFEEAVAATVCYRLLLKSCATPEESVNDMFSSDDLRKMIEQAMLNKEHLEYGHTMAEAVRRDALAVLDRDPACDTLLEVVLFMKGFSALVCHRAARQKWYSSPKRRSMTALFLQSAASQVFGVDIHPAATMGGGVMLDHGTGIVIGETAVVGDGCTLLHGVTLGGTGKDSGDRHPKLGDHVLIGAGASVLGNIRIGRSCKIGAGSIVLRDIPAGATAVGAPAKIIGKVVEPDPAATVDEGLRRVSFLHKSKSMEIDSEIFTAASSEGEAEATEGTTTSMSDIDDDSVKGGIYSDCPFRDYRNMAKKCPRGSATICTFEERLKKTGVDRFEIYSTFFELDQDNVGHVHWNEETQLRARESLLNNTRLAEQQVDEIMKDLAARPPVKN